MAFIRLGLLACLAAAAPLASAIEARADDNYQWGDDGSGACYGSSGACLAVVSPWWEADAFKLTTKYTSCTTAYWASVQGSALANGENALLGIAYQTTGNAFSWDDTTLEYHHPAPGTPSSPGTAGVGLLNWAVHPRHIQMAAACLTATPPPPSATTAGRRRVRIGRDYGAWAGVLEVEGGRHRVVRQVVLGEGATWAGSLACPKGTVRSGGVDWGVGYAMKQRPKPRLAEKTDVRFSASPVGDRGAEVTLRPKRLVYPTVVQMTMDCR